MKQRFRGRPQRDRDDRPRHRIRGDKTRFNRRGGNFRDRRRNFNDSRRPYNRPFKPREKLTEENLNDDLDNYFERKGGDSLKERLDNDIDMYQNNARENEKIEKETIALPPKVEEKTEEKVEENKQEENKKEPEKKEEEKEKKQEMEVEEKKVEKKKKTRAKKQVS